MRMQIHPGNDANSNAELRKAKSKADRNCNGRKEVAPSDKYFLIAGCGSDSVTLLLNSKTAAKNNNSRSLQTKH